MQRLIFFALTFLLTAAGFGAEPLRVTTWNLRWFPGGSPTPEAGANDEERIAGVATVLKGLRADVILLQDVRDEAACRKLLEQLLPEPYQLLVCSSFPDESSGEPSRRQVAILARQSATNAWAEAWQTEDQITPPGGFAFAAIPHADGLVGVYVVQLKNNVTRGNLERETQINILKREIAAEQLVRHSRALEARLTNHLDTVIVGGNFNTTPDQTRFLSEKTLRVLEDAGFANAFYTVAPEDRVTCPAQGRYADATFDYLFARGATFLGRPEIARTDLADHYPVTVALTAGAALPVVREPAVVPVAAPPPLAVAPAPAPVVVAPDSLWRWVGLMGLAFAVLFVFSQIFLRAQATDAARASAGPLAVRPWTEGGPAEVVSREPAAAVQPHLLRLMKDRLVQALLGQRSHLLESQQAAALQVEQMNARLLKVQSMLQQRLNSYEARIAELQKEIAIKDAENKKLRLTRPPEDQPPAATLGHGGKAQGVISRNLR